MRVIDHEYDRKALDSAGLIGKVKLTTITPQLAAKWLATAALRRKPSKKRVAKFIKYIRDGKWNPSVVGAGK